MKRGIELSIYYVDCLCGLDVARQSRQVDFVRFCFVVGEHEISDEQTSREIRTHSKCGVIEIGPARMMIPTKIELGGKRDD